jgi:hypothetical protein
MPRTSKANTAGSMGGRMKIALYITDGIEQIVLTPETETEKGILGKLSDVGRRISVFRGGFYECQGGWIRESRSHDSTIIRLREPENGHPEPGIERDVGEP